MSILLVGANGQLGRCLQDRAAQLPLGLMPTDREELDITDAAAVEDYFSATRPQLVINAAAYTAVDKAESEPELAYRINALGPQILARACTSLKIPLIHVSTDYVFDGTATRPYQPEDPVAPLGVYGETKLAGERMVAEVLTQHVILRTAWLFSEYGNNFVKTMLRLGAERDSLSIVADQYGCPTYAGDLADAIVTIACQCLENRQAETRWGTYHYCGDMPTSWHGFARAIFADAEQLGLLKQAPELQAISSAAYPTPAKRPAYSVLDSRACLDTWQLPAADWRAALTQVIARAQ